MNNQEGAFFYLGTNPHPEHVDKEAARLGMWLFLLTELLLFGVLFLAYSVYRTVYTHDFQIAAQQLDRTVGFINTLILFTSCLTVVISMVAVKRGNKALALWMMFLTITCAVVFLVIKWGEWSAKFEHDLYLVPNFLKDTHPISPKLNPGNAVTLPDGQIVFFGLYFVITGLHALHVIVGIVYFSVMAVFIYKDIVNKNDSTFLENAGLYWHIVDLIWIFVFPFFYLIV